MRYQQQKEKLGQRFTCFTCSTKFYDLGKPVPLCPECGADQREAPSRDIRTLLTASKTSRKRPIDEDDDELATGGGMDDEDIGLLGNVDDEDDDDRYLDEDEDDEDDAGMEDEDVEEEMGGGDD